MCHVSCMKSGMKGAEMRLVPKIISIHVNRKMGRVRRGTYTCEVSHVCFPMCIENFRGEYMNIYKNKERKGYTRKI